MSVVVAPQNVAAPRDSAAKPCLLPPVEEVARLLGVCERTVRRLAKDGRMPRPVAVGRSQRWRAREIRAWVEAGCPARRSAAV